MKNSKQRKLIAKITKITDIWFDRSLTIISLAILLGVAAYVIWIGFSYYWDFMHSDIAGDLLFVREARYQRSLFPYGWGHMQEMRFFHLTTVILPIYVITGNIHLSYPLAVALLLVLNMYLFYFMLSYRKRSMLPIILGFTTLLIIFARYAMFSIFSILFINGSLAPSLATIFVTIGAYMRIKNPPEGGRGRNTTIALWVLPLVIAVLQGIQSTRLLIALYLPLLIVECYPLVVQILREKGFDYKKTDKSTIFVIACMACNLLGVAIITVLIRREIVLVEYALMTSGLNMTPHTHIWDNIYRLITEFFHAFGFISRADVYSQEGIAYLGRLFLIIVLPIILTKTAAKDSQDSTIFYFMRASTFTLIVTMIITFTGVGERFMFTLVVLFAVMVVMVLEYFIENKRRVLTCIACAFLFLMVTVSVRTLNVERHESLVQHRQLVADFIIENEVTIGYAPFWLGLSVAAVGNFEFEVIYINASTFATRPHAITLQRYNHDQNRVFLVLSIDQVNNNMHNEANRAIMESGERHDFPGGWVVFILNHNPFR